MLQEIVRSEVKKAVALARSKHPQYHIPMPSVAFSNRMTKTGGKCGLRQGHYTVTFSLPIMHDNDITAYCEQVVYHEVAHMVDRVVYGEWGHGATFYRVMRTTLERSERQSTRYHTFKTAPTKKMARDFVYKCACCGYEMGFTSIRHNKARKALEHGGCYRHPTCPHPHNRFEYVG